MSKYLALFLVFIVCVSSCKKKPEDVVKDVNGKVEKINNKLSDYKPKTVDDIISPAPGTITGYFREEEIKKLYAEHYTDTDRVFTEYYFDDGMLIFILKQDFIYNRPNTYTEEKARANNDSVWYDDKKTRLEITRFYFNKNNLVKWVGPGNREVLPGSTEFFDKQTALWAEAAILIKEVRETP